MQLDRWLASVDATAVNPEIFDDQDDGGESLILEQLKGLQDLRQLKALSQDSKEGKDQIVMPADVRAEMAKRDAELLQKVEKHIGIADMSKVIKRTLSKLEALIEHKEQDPELYQKPYREDHELTDYEEEEYGTELSTDE